MPGRRAGDKNHGEARGIAMDEPESQRKVPGADGADGIDGSEGSGAPRAEDGYLALFRTGRDVQRLADDWVVLRRDAFHLEQRLRRVEDRLVAIEGRSTGDAHAKLGLLIHVLQHDLGLAPDHRALLLIHGALAALECVHRTLEPPA
jgi:hypothetical protein